MVPYLLKNFPQFVVVYTVKGFGIVNNAEIISWQIVGETVETVADFILWGSKITADGVSSHEVKKMLAPWNKSYDQPRQLIKKQRHYFADKGPYSQSYGVSRCHIWI